MKKENTCYKVLQMNPKTGYLRSCSFTIPTGAITRYLRTKETFPVIPGTPLMAFDSFDCAVDFCESFAGVPETMVVYECRYSDMFEYSVERVLLPLMSGLEVVSISDIQNFWFTLDLGDNSGMKIPYGTILVKSVKLVKQVYFLEPV